MSLLYAIAHPVVRLGFYLAMRLTVEGREHVPRNGPLIVVANHLNAIDPPLLGVVFPRQIVFMAKDELFKFPAVLIVRSLGAFSARKIGKSGMGIREALKVLGNGKVLGIFPEGKRSSNHKLAEGEDGVAYIALRSGARIVPVGISGSEKFTNRAAALRRPRVRVTIGEPFSFGKTRKRLSSTDLMDATDRIMRQIAGVLPREYRGVYDVGRNGRENGNQAG